MGSDLLMTRAKKLTGQNSSNNGMGEVITDGSTIIIGEGECAIATEGGKVIGIYDQPGEQIFRSRQSGGIFGGGLGAFMKDVGRRISFGGDAAIHQRLYYINTKELTGGTIRAEDVPLRYKDPKTGLDMDGRLSCHGRYTFRIADPERFYKAAIRSTRGRSRTELLEQMDAEVADALIPALAQLTEEGVRPAQLLTATEPLRTKLCEVMREHWSGLRGIEVFSVALDSIILHDVDKLQMLQESAAYQDPAMASGRITGATANAMETAAANEAVVSTLAAAIMGKPSTENREWKCNCGAGNTGKFCTECGAKNPADVWQNQCRHCGWKAEEQLPIPKYCTNCGKAFEKRNNTVLNIRPNAGCEYAYEEEMI
jgi:membrane protease subunit (stomatin/prohibitin family)